MEIPEPQYVKTEDGAYIAYQVVGDGPVDIAWQFGHMGDIDLVWGLPWESTWFEGLASFARAGAFAVTGAWLATGVVGGAFCPAPFGRSSRCFALLMGTIGGTGGKSTALSGSPALALLGS